MFPTFPYLIESIAAERAADSQREAAAYRRARGLKRVHGVWRPVVRTSHAGARPHARPGQVAACAATPHDTSVG
jgi:hypothetical protein